MKILIFSDTHRMLGCMRDVINDTKTIDLIVHAGDLEEDVEQLQSEYPEITIKSVPGNCDYSSFNAADLVFEVGGKKIFLTHGHKYYVKEDTSLTRLKRQAKIYNADIVIFGHTHSQLYKEEDGLIIINPGTAGYFRNYAVMEIKNPDVSVMLKTLS